MLREDGYRYLRSTDVVTALLCLFIAVTIAVSLWMYARGVAKEREETLEGSLTGRIDRIRDSLKASTDYLADAMKLIATLQQEIAARQNALEELTKQIQRGERLATIGAEATKALDEMMTENQMRSEKRIGRLAWWQGVLFALFGAAVAVIVAGLAGHIESWFR